MKTSDNFIRIEFNNENVTIQVQSISKSRFLSKSI